MFDRNVVCNNKVAKRPRKHLAARTSELAV